MPTINLTDQFGLDVDAQPAATSDPEVEEVLQVDGQKQLFDDVVPQPHIPSPDGTANPASPTLETDGDA